MIYGTIATLPFFTLTSSLHKKFAMKTTLRRDFWLIFLISVLFNVLGVLSIETATTIPITLREKLKDVNGTELLRMLNNSRRIIQGNEAGESRPYMVYLKLPASNPKYQDYRRWLCGGVIVHEEYILTSAACIQDVSHFYVVSGTSKFSYEDDKYNNPCIKNGAKKAVWKCIPKNYIFDGHENDNIRWMNNDLAVVKLEDEFDFTRKVRGCEYTPRPICYNNQSTKYEAAGQAVSLAGWGSTERYDDWVNSRKQNTDAQALLEAGATILDKTMCRKRWGKRYQNIIENYMICTADLAADLSEICREKYVDCTDIAESSEEDARKSWDPENMRVHSANHGTSLRRQNGKGGFCENDHGGPLVHGTGVNALVIGIISACLVKEKTNVCYGPFLYTSIFKNKVLINCAIYKNVGDCNKKFRVSETHDEVSMNWSSHPDGPAKNEIPAMRRQEEEAKRKAELEAASNSTKGTNTSTTPKGPRDVPYERLGLILRSGAEEKKPKIATTVTASHSENITTTTKKVSPS